MNVIEVKNLSKEFIVPHERRDSIRESLFSFFSRKSFEKFKALNDISFEIKKGEFLGIVGRNGSGKSTLLKLLAGVYYPTSGDIKVKGRLVPFLELGVGFNMELSGRENIFLNAVILGLSEKEIADKYDEIVRFAELEKFMDQKLKNYSSGMQVRLAFSIAMQAKGDVYLMDEVLAVGDTNFQMKCFDKFQSLKAQGKTIIFVSHDLASIRRFCDRVIYLKNACIERVGQVSEVIDAYLFSDSELVEDKIVEAVDKSIAITKVSFMSEGKNVAVLNPKKDFRIRVYYSVKKRVEDLILGIAIYTSKGELVYGTNSMNKSVKLDLFGDGYIDFFCEKNVLFSGRYFLTVAFHSSTGKNYDWRDKEYSFEVISTSFDSGLVDLNFKLK